MKNPNICLVGGGHGLSTVLESIRDFDYISAIVAVTDSGGSTGTIRTKFECPAIGDIRKCLNTLGDEHLRDIFERRIRDYGDCVGNLIIASLIKLYDFNTAIKIMHKLLGLKETHRVIPVSLDNFDICGTYRNNKEIKKETDFNQIEKVEKVELKPIPTANTEAIEAIRQSDFVIICPGSFFTSILANLLVPGIAKEINKKEIVWIVNLMQQYGETIGMDINDHANYLLKFVDHLDFVLVNNGKPSANELKNYESYLIPLMNINKQTSIKHIIEDDFTKSTEESLIHSSAKLNKFLEKILHE